MKDRVPKERMGTRLNNAFLKINQYEPTLILRECEIGSDLTFMQFKTKIWETIFLKTKKKCEIKNSSESVLQILFLNFGFKYDSSQQINCENFIMGCIIDFRGILDQRLARVN